MTNYQIRKFVAESNAIEGIDREPLAVEIHATTRFLELTTMSATYLEELVQAIQPGARLRTRLGDDVRIGNHRPPPGGLLIKQKLQDIIDAIPGSTAYQIHLRYEDLHPFTDGNGRSGRALWAWQIRDLSLGFLHRFYYQTLAEAQLQPASRTMLAAAS